MSALQLSPITGVSSTAAGASPAGEAAATQKSTSTSKTATSSQPSVASAAQAAQAAHATAAVDAAAAESAAAENARQVARIETPSLNLSVGLVGGTFDVYVDLTDPLDNRVVARLYGPKGSAPEPQHPAPTRVRTEA